MKIPGTDRQVMGEVAIAYLSRHLNETEQKYSTIEKEFLSIIYALKKFYHYIYGQKITIFCDHCPLSYTKNRKDPTGRIGRWHLEFMNHDVTIKHIPGNKNKVADCLSRIPKEKTTEKKTYKKMTEM